MNIVRTLNTIGFASVMALMIGCAAVGPNYQRPEVKASAQWKEPLNAGETNIPASLGAWWKNFNDPELDSLIDRALKSNLDLRMAQARVREARARYRIAAANLWPTVDAASSYARAEASHHQPVLSIPLPSGVPFENNVYQAGFDASWELDVFGGKRRATEAAHAEVEADEYGRRATLMTLLGDVARNYLEVRGDQRRLSIARENIKAQEEGLAITRSRFAHGLVSNLDVQQALTLLANTRADVFTLESSLQAAVHRLDVLLGEEPGELLAELSRETPIPAAAPVVPVGLPSELLLRRPDVLRAERQLAAATAQIGVAKSDLFPKFYLTGIAGFESVSASDWFTSGSKFWSVGPSVQWRIFDAGRIRSNIKVQNVKQEQSLAAYEQTVLTAFEDVENQLVFYAKEQQRRGSLQEAVSASQNSLQLAKKLYGNGLTSFLNVLDAERSLYQSQDLLAHSDQAVAANLVGLYKALGGGWQFAEQTTPLVALQTSRSNR